MNTLDLLKDLAYVSANSTLDEKVSYFCCPLDKLPRNKLKGVNIIVFNTDISALPGSHWICMFVHKNKVELMDSLGQNPNNDKYISKFVKHQTEGAKNKKKRLVYTTKPVQSDYSSLCGNYAAVYAYQKCVERKSLKNFLKQFSNSDLIANDEKIAKLYTDIFLNKNKRKRHRKRGKTLVQTGGVRNKKICIQSCTARCNAYGK